MQHLFISYELNHLNLKILYCRCGRELYRCERKLRTHGSQSKGVDRCLSRQGKVRLLHQDAISAWPTTHTRHRCCSDFLNSSCSYLFVFICSSPFVVLVLEIFPSRIPMPHLANFCKFCSLYLNLYQNVFLVTTTCVDALTSQPYRLIIVVTQLGNPKNAAPD